MDSVTPKWAREAQEHLVKLSIRLDAAEAYIKSLEALRDEMLAALERIANAEELDGDSFVCDFQTLQSIARAAIAKAKGAEA